MKTTLLLFQSRVSTSIGPRAEEDPLAGRPSLPSLHSRTPSVVREWSPPS